jgi:hypothetical protein
VGRLGIMADISRSQSGAILEFAVNIATFLGAMFPVISPNG